MFWPLVGWLSIHFRKKSSAKHPVCDHNIVTHESYISIYIWTLQLQTISKNKNENQTSRLGVESRFVKKGVFPQNTKTMSYD